MSIDLGCGYVTVAQKLLYASEVCAVHQQICGKTVPESVRTHMFGYSSQESIPANHALDTSGRESVKVTAKVYGFTPAIAYE